MASRCLSTSVPHAEEWMMAFTESFRSDFLYPVFRFFSTLGEEYFLLGAVVLALHFIPKRTAMQITLLVIIAALINSWLKGFFQECRPLSVTHLIDVPGYSFPSGHAQVGSAFWSFFVWRARHTWQKLALLFVIFMIALSRPYLGVHYFHDVGVGLVIGLSLSSAFYRWGTPFLNKSKKNLWLLLLCFGLSFMNPEESFKIFGALASLNIAWEAYQKENLPSQLFGRERLLSLFYSVMGVFVFWWALKVILELSGYHSPFLSLARYFLLCFWLVFFSPYLATYKKSEI